MSIDIINKTISLNNRETYHTIREYGIKEFIPDFNWRFKDRIIDKFQNEPLERFYDIHGRKITFNYLSRLVFNDLGNDILFNYPDRAVKEAYRYLHDYIYYVSYSLENEKLINDFLNNNYNEEEFLNLINLLVNHPVCDETDQKINIFNAFWKLINLRDPEKFDKIEEECIANNNSRLRFALNTFYGEKDFVECDEEFIIILFEILIPYRILLYWKNKLNNY